jgi:GT2 family glycosyltransferase/glycosyltransferase involved in cell wall biosynthesis
MQESGEKTAAASGGLSFLREKIAANQALAAKFDEQLKALGPRSPVTGAEARRARKSKRLARSSSAMVLPAPSAPRDPQETLAQQARDPSFRSYPGFSMKVAARLRSSELGLSPPNYEMVRRRGGLPRLFRQHLGEAREAGGPGVLRFLRRWLQAFSSTVVDGLRSKPAIPSEFDELFYLLLHTDVAEHVAAGDFRSGYEHWMKFGKEEGRVARVERRPSGAGHIDTRPGRNNRENIPENFDEDAYLFFNPDVSALVANGSYASGYRHWLAFGRKEGRGGGLWEEMPNRSRFLPLMESRPYGVNLYGFLSSLSGLSSVARGCVQGLESIDIPLNKIAIPSWEQRAAAPSQPDSTRYRVNLLVQNPDMFPRLLETYGAELLEGCYNIGYWLWELPSIRGDWHPFYRFVDEIWVPSEFCRQAFQSITNLPVVCIPPVVEGLEARAIYSRDHFGLPRDTFVFAYSFDVSSYLARKNPFCLIEAFKREFGNSRDVLLLLQYFNAEHDQNNIRALEQAIAGAPNIRSISRTMDSNEIASLHSSIDCLVSPHRGEGFGYNLTEAMYLGKPVIATRYSSNLDFMSDQNSYLIDYKLAPIPASVGPYRKGFVWADPCIDHLCHLMRNVFEDSAGRAAKGKRAAEDIRAKFSGRAVGRKIGARLQEIGLGNEQLSPTIVQVHGGKGPRRFFHSDVPSEMVDEVRGWVSKPTISVITPVYNVKADYLRLCIESVRWQYYPFWELCLCDDGSTSPETIETLESYRGTDPRIKIVRLDQNQGIAAASNRAAEIATGDYLAMLDNDDELAPEALYEVAKAIQADPNIDLLYTDEDKIDEHGEFVDDFFKPDWSPEHLLSVMYMLHMLVVRKDLFYSVGGFCSEFSGAQDYDLALRVSTEARSFHHVPKILYHWRKTAGSAADLVFAKPDALHAGARALEEHVWRNEIDATVEEGLLEGTFRVRYRIPGQPLASLCIMASNNRATVPGRGNIDLLENFVKSIAAKTDYPNYEIVVVDDGNLSESTCRALADIPYRLESFTVSNTPFNFSKKANFAFRQARGRYIFLLNDDLEVISPDWLGAMIEFVQQEEIGVVGARLLLADDRIQHVGLVLGVNNGAAHAFHEFPAGSIGYNAYTHLIRNYSAVSAACMATRADVIERAGGFDEQFATDFNDIDFCLRVIREGYRIVYTPYAELYHFEGTSIKRKIQDPHEVALFNSRWSAEIQNDPYYNVNLTRVGTDFSRDARLLNRRGRNTNRSKSAAI